MTRENQRRASVARSARQVVGKMARRALGTLKAMVAGAAIVRRKAGGTEAD
jgi:hypothetical protein